MIYPFSIGHGNEPLLFIKLVFKVTSAIVGNRSNWCCGTIEVTGVVTIGFITGVILAPGLLLAFSLSILSCASFSFRAFSASALALAIASVLAFLIAVANSVLTFSICFFLAAISSFNPL